MLCNNKCKLLPNSYPGVCESSCDCGGGYIGETKKHQLNTKKIAWQENGKRRVQLDISKITMGGLIGSYS